MMRAPVRFTLLVLLALLLPIVGVIPVGGPPTVAAAPLSGLTNSLNKLHPLLLSGLRAEPNRKVEVLVRRSNSLLNISSLLRLVTATEVRDFPFVKTTAMTISLTDVLTLALSGDVAYISPDSVLRETAAPPEYR